MLFSSYKCINPQLLSILLVRKTSPKDVSFSTKCECPTQNDFDWQEFLTVVGVHRSQGKSFPAVLAVLAYVNRYGVTVAEQAHSH